MTIDAVEPNVFVQRMGKGEFDAVLSAWHTDPSPSAVQQAWGSRSVPPQGANFARYSSKAFDALVDSGARAFDPAAARRYFTDAYSVIDADAPAVWLYEAKNTSAVSRRVKVAGTRPDTWWSGLPDWTVSAR